MRWKTAALLSLMINVAAISMCDAAPRKYRICKTLDAALVCDTNCEEIGNIEFRVSVQNNYVVRKMFQYGWKTTINDLGHCGVWDENNWECEERDPNPIRYYSKMNAGHFIHYLGNIPSTSLQYGETYCSK